MGVSSTFFTKFKKVITLVGSNREGERHTAADQAFRMCDENDLSLQEALDGAFGNEAGSEDLRRQIEELEEDNRRLAEAVNVLNAQNQTIPEDAGKQLLRRIWSYPQARLIWVYTGMAFYFVGAPTQAVLIDRLHRGWGHYWYWVNLAWVGLAIWDWACAEFARSDVGVTVLKAVTIISGFLIAIGLFGNDAYPACFLIIVDAALTITNGARWLADQMAHSNDEVFATLRSWFA